MTQVQKQILPALHNSGKVSDPDLSYIGDRNYTATILKYGNLALAFPQLKTDAKQVVPAINECRVIANPVPLGSVLETESGEPIQAENGPVLEPDGDYSSEDSGSVDAEILRTIQIKDTVYSIEGGGGTSDYSDLTNKPTINNVTLSGNITTSELLISYADILNTPSLKTVATSGKYTDLSSKPQINGHTLTGNQSSADLGITTSLTNLTDVNVSSAQNNDVLKYDSVTSKWINATTPSGASALADLTDTSISDPANLQELVYNGSSAKWENRQTVWEGTQAQYDAIAIKDPNVVYYITDTNGNNNQFQPIIYSKEEREIGVWTDGKPLYQKTYIYTPTAPLNVASLSIDKVIDLRAVSYQTLGTAVIAVPYGWDSGDRALFYYHPVNKTLNFSYASMNGGEWFITVRYTKTTDTAGSGTWTPQGVPTSHYSLNEQVVGTWVDGSTIYERTYNPTVTSSDQTFSHGISNLGTVVSITGMCTYNNQAEWLCLPYVAMSNTYSIALSNVTATTFRFICGSGFSSIQNLYVTLRYTKSS